MPETHDNENERLARSWQRHDRGVLRDYLVGGVEDPRINVQSVLTRHFLAESLHGQGAFPALRQAELRFAAAMNWLLGVRKDPATSARHEDVLAALLDAGPVEQFDIPAHVRATFAALPAEADGLAVPDYISDVLVRPPAAPEDPPLDEASLSTFQALWSRAAASAGAPPRRLSALEPACGSANDYRFLASFGLAGGMDYTGVDIAAKNVRNALEMFPDADFRVGSAMALDADDDAFDLLFVHDLFEHLSVEAMRAALAECARVTREAMLLHFFQMHDDAEHLVRPVDEYHWNRLSLPRIRELLAGLGWRGEAVRVADFLGDRVGCEDHHNPHAWTLLAEPVEAGDRAP